MGVVGEGESSVYRRRAEEREIVYQRARVVGSPARRGADDSSTGRAVRGRVSGIVPARARASPAAAETDANAATAADVVAAGNCAVDTIGRRALRVPFFARTHNGRRRRRRRRWRRVGRNTFLPSPSFHPLFAAACGASRERFLSDGPSSGRSSSGGVRG